MAITQRLPRLPIGSSGSFGAPLEREPSMTRTRSGVMGSQRSGSSGFCSPLKPRSATPTTVTGSPLTRTVRPSTDGSAPNLRRQTS